MTYQVDFWDTKQSTFGSVNSPKQFSIQSIEKGVAAALYSKYHYFGDKDFLSLYNFGALHEGLVWGSITFGIPNAPSIIGLYDKDNQEGVLEITRLAFRNGSPKNSCSYLISRSIKELKKRYPVRIIITYADTAHRS